MKLATLILFTFALILLTHFKTNALTTDAPPAPTPTSPPPIIYWNYIFALNYGHGICDSQTCKKPQMPTELTIHGLWPNVKPPAPPSKPATTLPCSGAPPLTLADISSLQPILNKKWPNILDYGNSKDYIKFWNSEWQKHGFCSHFNKLQYFQQTLQLMDELDPSPIVQTGALKADDTKLYTEADVLTAFNNNQPYILCKPGKRGSVLTDLYFCMDTKAQIFVNCSTFYSTNSNCKGSFKILNS